MCLGHFFPLGNLWGHYDPWYSHLPDIFSPSCNLGVYLRHTLALHGKDVHLGFVFELIDRQALGL